MDKENFFINSDFDFTDQQIEEIQNNIKNSIARDVVRYEKSRHSPERRRRKKLPVYWIGLGMYVVILLIVSWQFLSYTDKCLIQYEDSQPDHAMEKILIDFKKMVGDGAFIDDMSIPSASKEFESGDIYRKLYCSQLDDVGSYTFEKDTKSYLTEQPVYDIFADGTQVAQITLSATNEHTIFGILTIMDWNVKEIQPVFNAKVKEYLITIPDNYQVTLNGVPLDEKYLTGKTIENPDFVNVSEYVEMPALVEYKVEGLAKKPKIKVYNEKEEEVSYTSSKDGHITVDFQSAATDMPQEYYDDALKMAKAWEDFLTKDLVGEHYGLRTIQQYLIRDSYYWNMAESYAYGVDITLISDHTIPDPPYGRIHVSDYISYGENCYSCHIYIEKNMYLTEMGRNRVDTLDSTFYFVKYDDSDDGVDNPHWAIVDMIATTNNHETS